MAKWKSSYQSNEAQYQQFFKQVYPQLAEKMQAFVDSYDDTQPVAPDEQMIAHAPLALMRRRMAKHCVWPAIKAIETTQDRGRAVTESIEKFIKPLQDTYDAKKKEQEKHRIAAFQEAAKSRKIVKEGVYRSASNPGDIDRIHTPNEIDCLLTCISCEYIRQPEDYGQYESGYLIRYAEPTDEEMQTEAYQNAKRRLDADLSYQETLRNQSRILIDRNEW